MEARYAGPIRHSRYFVAQTRLSHFFFDFKGQPAAPKNSEERDWTAQKYAMWERGEKLTTQVPNSVMKCPCGETFDSHDPAGSYEHRRHIYTAQQTAAAR
jgi:hypothetical protein